MGALGLRRKGPGARLSGQEWGSLALTARIKVKGPAEHREKSCWSQLCLPVTSRAAGVRPGLSSGLLGGRTLSHGRGLSCSKEVPCGRQAVVQTTAHDAELSCPSCPRLTLAGRTWQADLVSSHTCPASPWTRTMSGVSSGRSSSRTRIQCPV